MLDRREVRSWVRELRVKLPPRFHRTLELLAGRVERSLREDTGDDGHAPRPARFPRPR
jgi:hypothetical protein